MNIKLFIIGLFFIIASVVSFRQWQAEKAMERPDTRPYFAQMTIFKLNA